MAADYTALLRKLIPDPGGEDTVRMRTATVTAINSNGTVRISMSGVTIPKDIPRLASSGVLVGDTVSVISFRGQLLVIGPVAEGPVAGVIETPGINFGNSRVFWNGRTAVFDNTTDAGIVLTNGIGIQVARDGVCLHLNRVGGSNGAVAQFRHQGVVVGSISVTDSATVYNTSSDYRLKKNVREITDGLDRVNALRPVAFDWVSGGSGEGFIAHEVQEVVPLAVTGEKDAVAPAPVEDDDPPEGSIIPQAIDQSKLIPILTSAIQELSAKVEALTTRVAELENQLGSS